MKLKEDSQLNNISKKFSYAVKKFTKRDYKVAAEDFGKIINEYKNSEFYSVLEVQTRAKSYKNICDSKNSRKKAGPESEDDILNELLFNININEFDDAENVIKKIDTKKISSPYSNYLRSILAFKQGDLETSLRLLRKSVGKDEKYKIMANNEPDLQELQENGDFLDIIE